MWFWVVILLILAILIYFVHSTKTDQYFDPYKICPQLKTIHESREKIRKEIRQIYDWTDWPETELYKNGEWKIFPFYAFGIWVNKNCEICPELTEFIRRIPNLKLATLSRLSPGTKLAPHCGWGNHSNYVLRAHYGIDVPDNCYVEVESKRKYHKNDTWLLFDDSLQHMAGNESEKDRIVLIVDIERPTNIPKGKSTIGDTKELVEIVRYFRDNNLLQK
mgnify:CR=1 FL=1